MKKINRYMALSLGMLYLGAGYSFAEVKLPRLLSPGMG